MQEALVRVFSYLIDKESKSKFCFRKFILSDYEVVMMNFLAEVPTCCFFIFIAYLHCKSFISKQSEVLPFLKQVLKVSFKKSVELNPLTYNAES